MKFRSLFMQWLALCFIVFASLALGYYAFFIRPPEMLIRDDGAVRWEERMQPVRSYLPRTVREVGYISDSDSESVALSEEYALTKYALAPVVVHRGVDYEWIIGNFSQSKFETILNQQISSDYTFKSFGAGIYLIHRTMP